MLGILFRKARSALWRIKHEWAPYTRIRIGGELGYRLGRKWGALRGWRRARPDEIVWLDPDHSASNPRLLVARFKDAFVYRSETIVVARDYRLISDISTPPSGRTRDHDVLHLTRLPEATHFPGTIAAINASMYDHFYHWMLETVPRFGLIKASGLPIDRFMVSSSLRFQAECLEVLGISKDQTVSPTADQMLLIDDLVAPSITGPHLLPTSYSVRCLREMFSKHLATTPPSRRLYITRADAPTRRVVNESALIAALLPMGFEVAQLSDFHIAEQARTFSEAEIVIGPHGAGMTHVVFVHPKSLGMIEFMPETYSQECFRQICEINGTPYLRITSRTSDPAVHDIEVDIAAVVSAVTQKLGLAV